jgi:hypothetical protein
MSSISYATPNEPRRLPMSDAGADERRHRR